MDLYRFLPQERIGGDGRGFPAAPHNHTGVQERKEAHARRIFGALDGFVPARLSQVEQFIEVVDAGAIVREGNAGGYSVGAGLVVTETRDAPARRAFWSNSTKTWLSLLVNSQTPC